MATTINNGAVVTSTTTEQEFEITRPYTDPLQTIKLLWQSGTVQYAVGEKATAFTPVITATSGSLAAAGDKDTLDIENGKFNQI
jgi:hypothetical protein